MKKPHVLSFSELKQNAIELPVTLDLPQEILGGIGRILSLHAYMEWRLSLVVYALLDIDSPEGRIAWAYHAPQPRAKVIRSLFEWNGAPVDMKNLLAEINDIGIVRDQLAHGIWVIRDGKIVLQSTREYTDFDRVRVRHDFIPMDVDVSGTYFEDQATRIRAATDEIEKLLITAKEIQEGRRASMIAAQISTTANRDETRSDS